MNIKNILFPSRPQADTLLSIFLLRKFGEKMFPGVSTADITFSAHMSADVDTNALLEQGTLALDIGGGELDHHNKEKVTLSELVARKLGMDRDPALEKIVEYVRRDDMYGKGTISKDPIDRAFGLSGLLTNLNKVHGTNHMKIVDILLPLIDAHHVEEYRRTTEMPKEVEERLKNGKAESFMVKQRDKSLKVIIIESDNPSMSGYLRSQLGGAHDVVAQWSSSGHLNILTRPVKKVDLRSLAAVIRATEMQEKGMDAPINELAKTGKIESIPEWYFDPATNSIQNGGMAPKDVPATKVEKMALKKLLELGLSEQLWKP